MKIICVGLNYKLKKNEIKESYQNADNNNPIIFLKPDSSLLNKDNNKFYIPDFADIIDYECELVVKINKIGKNIAERFAYRYYEEITLGIDFTARTLQNELKEKALPWELSKGFDNSAAIGNFVQKDLFNKTVSNLDFQLNINNICVQSVKTQDMIHSVDSIIAFVSRYFTLKTGDLIFTGYPFPRSSKGAVKIGDKLIGLLEGKDILHVDIC